MKSRIADRMQEFSPFYVMELLQKAKQLEKQGRDIIHMEIGEPDFLTPTKVAEAGCQFINSGKVKYTSATGLVELKEKIASFYFQRYGVTVAKERILITPGASGAFLLALGICINPDDEWLLADPCYPCNRNFIQLFGGRAQLLAVNDKTNFQLTADLIEQHWQNKTRGVLVASPANPTGSILPADAMNKAIAAVEKRNGNFCSDEIYHGLEYGAKTSTALQFSDNVFVINSFSKYFGMTGWRVGWLIVPEFFIQAAEILAQTIFISTPSHSQYAALAAFDEENLYDLEKRRIEFAKRGDFLYQKLLEIGFKIARRPEGAFYIYADCSQFTKHSFQFAQHLLDEEGVAITPGKDFGDHNADKYVRLAYTTTIERMEEGISRIKRFIERG